MDLFFNIRRIKTYILKTQGLSTSILQNSCIKIKDNLLYIYLCNINLKFEEMGQVLVYENFSLKIYFLKFVLICIK